MKHISLVVTLLAATGIACKKSPSHTPGSETPRTTAEPAPAAAPTPPPPDDPWSVASVKKEPLARPFFWAVEKAGKTTYVLGTMHAGVDPEARLPELVWNKLDAAPVLAVETDATDPAVLGMGKRTSGTLRDDLGPAYWKKLEALVEPRLLEGLNKMKPAMTVAMLSMRALPQTPSMDGVLLARAQNGKKRIVYLEPASKQARLLEKWLDIRSLKALLDSPDAGAANTRAMLDAYVSGDEVKMLELADSHKAEALKHGVTEREYEQQNEEMLYERNASWIDAIEKLHAEGNGFVAVGALHVLGKRSVLELLAARGYKITRLTP